MKNIYLGNNLHILRNFIESSSIDLVYLDPPFNSGRNYKTFSDVWHWDESIKLIERVIQSGSNPGDVFLDPFCGSGTSIIAAEKLKRCWVSIDNQKEAIDLQINRLKLSCPGIDFELKGVTDV